MRQRTLLCALTFLTVSVSAQDSTALQDSTFELKDYRYRTPGFRALSVGFNLNGSSFNQKLENSSKQVVRELRLSASNLHYYRTFSTDKRLHTSSISFSPSFYAVSNKNQSTVSKSRNLQSSFAWNLNDRFYKNNLWFFEAGNQFNYNGSAYRSKDSTNRQQSNNHNLQNTITLGFGKGRIENVQDAQMALYIINDLQQQGLLHTAVQPQTVQELARLITAINNRRVFDSRRRRIFELTQIDSFLRSSGLVTNTDIRHFTTVNDNWALAFNPGRLSGAHWYISLQPGAGIGTNTYNLQQPAAKHDSRHNNTLFTLAPMAGYEKYVPVSLKWQRNMGASLSWQKGWYAYHSKVNSSNQTFRQDSSQQTAQWSLHTFYGVGFYPNNRTQVTVNLAVEASRLAFEKSKHQNVTQLRPALQLGADYFISYQTRLFAQYNLWYLQNFYTHGSLSPSDEKQLNTNVSIGITHILF